VLGGICVDWIVRNRLAGRPASQTILFSFSFDQFFCFFFQASHLVSFGIFLFHSVFLLTSEARRTPSGDGGTRIRNDPPFSIHKREKDVAPLNETKKGAETI
jgi:hypothetical protein